MARKPDQPDDDDNDPSRGNRNPKDTATPEMPQDFIDLLNQHPTPAQPAWHRDASHLARSRGLPMGEA